MKENSFLYINGTNLDNLTGLEELEFKRIAFNNSAFLWGESIFTSGLVKEGKLTLWPAHCERLQYSCSKQFGQEIQNWQEVENKVKEIILKHEGFHGRFRLTFFYGKDSRDLHWHLVLKPFLPKDALSLKTSLAPCHYFDKDDRVKLGSYAHFYRREREEEGPLCWIDHEDYLLETSHGNVLFYDEHGSQWFSPDSDQVLMGLGLSYGMAALDVVKRKIKVSELSQFCAAFQLNAVHGPVPIDSIDGITFKHSNKYLDELQRVWEKACDK